MKVLFCTPYRQLPGGVFSGINIWARNILGYHNELRSTTEIFPVSFDRRYQVEVNTFILKRVFFGLRDYLHPIRETRSALKAGDIDVLHICSSAHISLLKDWYVLKMASKYNANSAIHFHFGRIPEVLKSNNWEAKLLLKVCEMANTVIVMDKASMTALENKGIENVCYLPNPVSDDTLNEIESFRDVKREKNKIVFVGHVIPTKGVYELVRASSLIEGIELHLVGTINEEVRNDLQKIASTKEDGNWLRIRGGMSHQDVIKEMLSSSIFVLPSYTEGFPNVILESMACGCPIIATSVGAIPEMLAIETDQQCGICVEPKNVESLHGALQKMLKNTDMALRYGRNAKERVREHYSVSMIWNQLVNIWEKI